VKLWIAALGLAAVACSDHDRHDRASKEAEAPRPRRQIEPPVGVVRALPPHPIRATSVGPYKLGEKLSDLLEQLSSGPRMELYEVPGLLHRSLIRAEDKAVLIGGEPQGTASFVAVVGTEVARTESNIHVGSTRAELVTALGPLVEELDRAHDPRLVIPNGLKNARVILTGSGTLDDDRISAIAILAEPTAPVLPPVKDECPRPASTGKAIGTCLTGVGELVELSDNEITIRIPDSEKAPVVFKVPNARFVAPLRTFEGRDELVVVTRTDEAQLRSWSLVAFRVESGKLTRSVDSTPLYQVTSANARWIGAEVREVDLYLELTNRGEGIEVGGLLTTRPDGGPTRDVVVISKVSAPHVTAAKTGKAAATDAGTTETPDGGIGPRDDSGSATPDSAKP
jgi:hypothetical protein